MRAELDFERLGLSSYLDWFQTRAISVELADFRWEGERLAFDVRQPLPLGVFPRGALRVGSLLGRQLGERPFSALMLLRAFSQRGRSAFGGEVEALERLLGEGAID